MMLHNVLLLSLSFFCFHNSYGMKLEKKFRGNYAPETVSVQTLDILIQIISLEKNQGSRVTPTPMIKHTKIKHPTKFPLRKCEKFINEFSDTLSEEILENTQQEMRNIDFSNSLENLKNSFTRIKSIDGITSKSVSLIEWSNQASELQKKLDNEPKRMSLPNYATFNAIYQSLGMVSLEAEELANRCCSTLNQTADILENKAQKNTNQTNSVKSSTQQKALEKKLIVYKELFKMNKVSNLRSLMNKLTQDCKTNRADAIGGTVNGLGTYTYTIKGGLEISVDTSESSESNPEFTDESESDPSSDKNEDIL